MLPGYETGEGDTAVDEATAFGFQVNVNGVSLVDLLQMFHMSRRSVTVRLPQGLLYVRDGEVIHAECGEVTGEAAVRRLLEVPGGELRTESLSPSPVSVRRPLSTVLLDALVYIDEQQGGTPSSTTRRVAPGDEPISTRLEHWDAICASINRNVDGAACSAVVDLNRRALLGGNQRSQLPEVGQTALLDVALALFSSNPFAGLEEVLREAKLSGEQASPVTQELYTRRGHLFYIGRRLRQDTAVLVVCATASLPALPMAQLKGVLAGFAS